MEYRYSNDKATRILVALLKAHNIHKVIVSPGTTNMAIVISMQYDPWFEMYSSVDERSAAYMACGLAAESGEPVILSCTEATASRNYLPGLTEAYYRKLPILVITGTHGNALTHNLFAQSLDRSVQPKDTVSLSVNVDRIQNQTDEWLVTNNINRAILELSHKGGRPVHINLQEATGIGNETRELPAVRVINRYAYSDSFPDISAYKKIVIFIGSHRDYDSDTTKMIEAFCEANNSVVITDHTSGYHGKYKILGALEYSQLNRIGLIHPDLLIHLGEVSGEYYATYNLWPSEVWRVSEDGEIKDPFMRITKIFEMSEQLFFKNYADTQRTKNLTLYEVYKSAYDKLLSRIPELPFGNIWIAQQIHSLLPEYSILHFSIFNSLRSWNFFELSDTIKSSCNVGGFGIDGALSTLLGASLAHKDVLHFCVIGDLAFFYDMNSLGNRHVTSNLRIMLVNNGKGTEFRNFDHPASKLGDDADKFIAAGGHYGNKSPKFVKAFVEALGFKYLTASCKEDFLSVKDVFLAKSSDEPIVMEVFTNSEDESEAIKAVRNIVKDTRSIPEKALDKMKSIAGRTKSIIKKL